jgi:hypothetical protein
VINQLAVVDLYVKKIYAKGDVVDFTDISEEMKNYTLVINYKT